MPEDENKITITYDTLVDLFRNEKKNSELQELDEKILDEILAYLKEKQVSYEEALKESELFAEEEIKKLERQLNNIRKVITSIYEKREEKIIKMALNKTKAKNAIIDTSGMLEYEKVMYDYLVNLLSAFRESILNNLMHLKKPVLPEKFNFERSNEHKKKKVKIRFIQPVPKFVDVDGKIYGPYDKNEIDLIPLEIAELLVKKKKAEFLK